MSDTIPVIVCDGCGLAVPARFSDGRSRPAVSEEQVAADLRGQGWTLGSDRDACPSCTKRERTSTRRGRPSLVQAIQEYDAKTFEHAAMLNASPLVHDVIADDDGNGYAKCGAQGVVGHPNLQAGVCLSCWPWWHA